MRNRCVGYTLIETLVALIIFALVSVATGYALRSAIRGQDSVRKRAEEMQEARALITTITRDIRAAYASAGNQYTFFVATGAETGTILTFTTLNHRITNMPPASSTDSSNYVPAFPQSDVATVQYSYDPDRGELNRAELSIPNPDALPQPGTPATLLPRRVHAIQFQYLSDPTVGLRSDWNYVTPAPQQGGQLAAEQPATDGDTTLPQSVQVMIELGDSRGMTTTYTAVIPVISPKPQPKGQVPDPPPTATSTGGTGGAAGPGGSGGPGGTGGTGAGGSGGLPGLSGTPGARP